MKKRLVPITEKQIEDVFEIFHDQLIEPGLELLDRQKTIKEYGVRFDLLFRDKSGKKLILELKRNAVTRDDIGQAIQYAGIVRNSRVVLAAPIIPTSIKNAFEHYGIEYIEYDLKKIEQLLKEINDKKKFGKKLKEYKLPVNIILEPLQKRKIRDGNVAIKFTYNDKGWKDICSTNIADYNCQHRTWCRVQCAYEDNCQSETAKRNLKLYGIFPCADAGALAFKDPTFYGGHYHGKKHHNEPIRYWNIKRNKIAVFTSRKPGEPENQRFIFFIGIISDIAINRDANGAEYEEYHCDHETGIYFDEEQYPKYWDFYRNPNNPERIAWNTGLFRYWTDKQVIDLLEWIRDNPRYDKKTRKKAAYLLSRF